MINFSIQLIYYLIFVLFIDLSIAVISNNTCAPVPRDKRQQICLCTRHLQLRCSFISDINRIETKDLDSGIKPIFYDNVTLARMVDFDDYGDINTNFELNKKRYKNNQKIFYLYFPDFKFFASPFIRLTLKNFLYVPSFAFTDQNNSKTIETVVFEMPEVYDFGIDQYAFFNLIISDLLLIEGPFNQITFHREAFGNSIINELIIGCYCIECESFDGKCRLRFDQDSKYPSLMTKVNKSIPLIKSIKLFGIEFDWNFDSLPSSDYIENLEISNSKFHQNPDFDIKIKKMFYNLQQFIFKNNNLQNIEQLNYFKNFPKLSKLNLESNEIDTLDLNSFNNLKFLIEIVMDNNNLEKIDSEIFGPNLINLKTLRLSQNKIVEIQNGAFKNLHNLEYLELSYNRLKSLGKDTFLGLKNLKELYISYNPFNNFDIDTFKHVLNLNRLDIISKTEIDWFNFENEDVCLLSYFKCETQINIDPDQRCNCFIKYVNFISSSSDNDASKWYKSCLPQEEKNLNRYVDETNKYLNEIKNLELNEKDPIIISKTHFESEIKCSENLVKSCFTNLEFNYINNSCLYRKFVSPEPSKLNIKQQIEEKITSMKAEISTNHVTFPELSEPQEIIKENYQTQEIFKEAVEFKEKKTLCKIISDENCIIITLVFAAAVLFISIISFLIGIYLCCNRRKYIYHAANSRYHQDE